MACSLGSYHIAVGLRVSCDRIAGGFANSVIGNQVARAGAGKLYGVLGDGHRAGVVQCVTGECDVRTVRRRHANRHHQ